MANSRQTIRRRLYQEIPELGFNSTADSVAAGSIVDSFMFQDSNLTIQHFKGTYIYRPGRSTDDRVKKAGSLTLASGTLAHTGANYADTADLDYEIVGLMHPDELNECIKRAQRFIYFETQVPLTLITDGDMSSSGTSSWTASNASHSKITTAANVFSGQRSSRVANSAADGYIQSGTVNVARSSYVYISAVCRADVGTAELILWDVTNSTELANVSTTEEGWVHLFWQGNVGSTTEQVALRLQGTEQTADIYWDYAILMRTGDMRIMAPSWLDEQFKLLKLREAAWATSLGSNVHDANSRYFRDWRTPSEFTLDPFHPEANAYAIQLIKPQPLGDLWIEGKRPFADLEPLTADTDTTVAPYDLQVAFSKLEVANFLVKRYPGEPRWEQLRLEAEVATRSEAYVRPDIPQSPRRRNPSGRI